MKPILFSLSFNHVFSARCVFLASLLCVISINVSADDPTEPNTASIEPLKQTETSSEQKDDGFFSVFVDPNDGQLDTSNWLSQQHGFLPVPIVITGPTFGFGFGLNLMFLHDKLGGDRSAGKKVPPSLSGLVAAGTENGTKLAAGYNISYLKQDTIRSTSFIGVPDANLDFYPTVAGKERQVEMNLNGLVGYQEFKFRVKDSNFFLGGNLFYSNVTSTFVSNNNIIDLPDLSHEIQAVSLAAVAEYDTRDSNFTPSKGLYSKLVAARYSETLGSDFDAWNIRAKSFYFTPIVKDLVLGLRGEFEGVQTDAPYYMYPSIIMRGMATGRYQGQFTTTFETEARYALNYRWSLIGFIGSGKAFGASSSTTTGDNFSDADWESAGGIGFRYKIAAKFGLHVGVDVAVGPEDTSVYITTGQAWNAVF